MYSEALCIGLGLSGVCLGVQLRRKFGFTDVHFYDRNESHSGTWCSNRYPGCACDVPAFFYSFSFELNPEWSCLLPPNYEIQAYLERVVDKYHLRPHMTFRTECESAKWDNKRQLWTVYLRNLDTGERIVHECRLLFSAVGTLVDGKEPDILGKETFEGQMFHTARWRSDVDLKDKEVILLGNGCSATQTVPAIAPVIKSLTQFTHTPHWILPVDNVKFGPKTRGILRNAPFLTRVARALVFFRLESNWTMFKMNKVGTWMRKTAEKSSTRYILSMAPEEYHDRLIPDFEFACKRRIFDPDSVYLKSLHSPNVHLTTDRIVEIVPQGVRTASQTYPADVIVFATGYHTNNGLGNLRIRGREGELHDHWRNMGGPGAYNSTAVHGFPNFFMIYGSYRHLTGQPLVKLLFIGPNSSTGHNSVLYTIENMVNYALKIIEPVIKGEASEVEVKGDVEKEYAERLQAASSSRLWNTCQNWYVTDGWNSTVYPWSQIRFQWRSTFPTWNHWNYKYTKKGSRRNALRSIILLIIFLLSIVGSVKTLNGNRLSGVAALASALIQKGRTRIKI